MTNHIPISDISDSRLQNEYSFYDLEFKVVKLYTQIYEVNKLSTNSC